MVFSWWKSRRRTRILATPCPADWMGLLMENVRHFGFLPAALQQRLIAKTRICVAERTWVSCGGLVIDDEVRVTIAAQACLLLIGYEDEYCFDRVRSVLVYPGAYMHRHRRSRRQDAPVHAGPMLGEAWPKGPLVLSWAHALAGGLDTDQGRNVVLHEFAHHLDDLAGDIDGTPPLISRAEHRRWERVIGDEYDRLASAARRGRATLLDHYGATDRGEFFAVATECFFMRPRALHGQHAELYAVLADFYRLDPAAWYDERPAVPEEESPWTEDDWSAYRKSVRRTLRKLRLRRHSADEAFAEGVIHAQHGHSQLARECFSECLRRNPQDSEAYLQRGLTLLESGAAEAALADLDEAVRQAPEEAEYYRARRRVHRALGHDQLAEADWRQARYFDPLITDDDD